MGFCVAVHYRISIMNIVYFTRKIRFLLSNDFESRHRYVISRLSIVIVCLKIQQSTQMQTADTLTSISNTILFPIGWLFLWSVVGWLHPTVVLQTIKTYKCWH